MNTKLNFSLVSPEREIFNGQVDQVVVPGAEGDFGVLVNHAPFMSTIKPGVLRVLDGASEKRIFIMGGFADVAPEGLTVLAEDVVDDLAAVDAAKLESDLKDAEDDVRDAPEGPARLAAERVLARARALKAAIAAR